MSAPAILSAPRGFAVPSAATIGRLFLGGYIALMAWEIWARTITAWVLGGPLEPPQLVISLVNTWFGFELSLATATFLHYVIGIVGYPVAYYVLSRAVPRWAPLLDGAVWLIFTAYVAYSLVRGGFTAWMGAFWLIVSLVTATRFINRNVLVANCLSWGSFTWFNALGIFAPLAGLPFLLMEWGGGLSFMSYVGHILYGFVAAHVFERLEAKG
jgi:hypothetical protein